MIKRLKAVKKAFEGRYRNANRQSMRSRDYDYSTLRGVRARRDRNESTVRGIRNPSDLLPDGWWLPVQPTESGEEKDGMD